MSKYKFIMINCGYVESNKTAPLIYGCQFMGYEGFSTCREAITELALDLYAKFHYEILDVYENRYAQDLKKCCLDMLIRDKNANFCPLCGSAIKDKDFNEESFMDFIRDLHGTDCDSYGEAEHAKDRHFVWWPWSTHEFLESPRDSIIWIEENAEHVLLCALYDAKPELRSKVFDVYGTVNTYSLPEWENFKNK